MLHDVVLFMQCYIVRHHPAALTVLCSPYGFRSTDITVYCGTVLDQHKFSMQSASVRNPCIQSLVNRTLPKPPSPYPVVIKPQQIAAAGFGEIIFALDFFVPPAAGKNVGAGEFVDGAVLGAENEPAVFVRMVRAAGEAERFCRDTAD